MRLEGREEKPDGVECTLRTHAGWHDEVKTGRFTLRRSRAINSDTGEYIPDSAPFHTDKSYIVQVRRSMSSIYLNPPSWNMKVGDAKLVEQVSYSATEDGVQAELVHAYNNGNLLIRQMLPPGSEWPMPNGNTVSVRSIVTNPDATQRSDLY